MNNESDYKTVLESYVWHEGRKISQKDIDVVLEYLEIELMECKASLRAFLYPEEDIRRKNRGKLNFMVEVKELSSYECHLFLAAYDNNTEFWKGVLQENGYEFFDIINDKRIIENFI